MKIGKVCVATLFIVAAGISGCKSSSSTATPPTPSAQEDTREPANENVEEPSTPIPDPVEEETPVVEEEPVEDPLPVVEQPEKEPEVKVTGYTETQYPIVLAPGFTGFRTLLGFIQYWPGIPSALEKTGAKVFALETSAGNSVTAQGEQVIEQVEDILALTGKERVNLISHSLGGLNVRYVLGTRPDLVASVTAIAGIHQPGMAATYGAADKAEDNPEEMLDTAAGFINFMKLIAGNDNPNDIVSLVESLTDEGVNKFNKDYPAGFPADVCGEGEYSTFDGEQEIFLFSWSGVGIVTNLFDFTDPIMLLTSQAHDVKNDGLVTRCDSHFGKVIRDDYDQNHLDEVNQMFGLVAIFGTKPISLFRTHANRLKNLGL